MGGTAFLLLAIVAGYWLLERAEQQKGGMKRLGRILGLVVIAIALIGTACKVYCISSGNYASCPVGFSGKGKGMYCPMSMRPSATTTPADGR
ncbi:MAG: hypothetical protein HYY14_05175 [Candidatus Omnitrophica bacterium]|nr:hypothetical protein [Candidatus Omnitrophota bacterium]